MDHFADILLGLLRQALGTSDNCQVDLGCVGNEDWNQIIDLAFEQGVDAISVDGYNSLAGTEHCLLESDELEDLRLDWFGSGFDMNIYCGDLICMYFTVLNIYMRL